MPHDDPRPEDLLELTIGPPAHGGHCVARHEGRVVFVRHTLPGERVLARITGRTSRFWRADAVQILAPSADRVESRWPQAGPGGVGGGELAHVALPAQREWKRDVVVDVLGRIGHIGSDHPVLRHLTVAPVRVPGPGQERGYEVGAGYRTRVELIADDEGRAGMYRHRSHEVVPLERLPLAHARIQALDLLGRRWPAGARIKAVAPSDGAPVVLVDGAPTGGAGARVREIVSTNGAQYRYRVRAAGFWQVHAAAPAALVSGVLAAADLQVGERAWDLYSGAGLLTAPLAAQVGAGGRVDAVEGDRQAAADARRNAHGLEQIVLHTGAVAEHVGRARRRGGESTQLSAAATRARKDEAPRRAAAAGPAAMTGGPGAATAGLWARPDVVVLDPPRTGAGAKVMKGVLAASPRRIVYVACDPAALARDVATAGTSGYELTALAGFDIFPHTHHVECIATLERTY